MNINIFNNTNISKKITIINSQCEECSICLDNLYNPNGLNKHIYLNCFKCLKYLKFFNTNNKKIVILNNCNHIFHEACINKWKNIKNVCPLCNKEFNYYIAINI
jgi:hypothetical protein